MKFWWDAGNFIGGSLDGIGRTNSTLRYVSPNFSAVNLTLTYIPAKSTISSTGFSAAGNGTGVKVTYAGNGITVSLTTFNMNVGTGFNVKPLSIGQGSMTVQYISSANEVGADTKRTVINIGCKLKVGDNDAIKAQVTRASDETVVGTTVANGTAMYALGYDYTLSKTTGIYVVYAKVRNGTLGTYNGWSHQNQLAAVAVGDNPGGFGVGLTLNF